MLYVIHLFLVCASQLAQVIVPALWSICRRLRKLYVLIQGTNDLPPPTPSEEGCHLTLHFLRFPVLSMWPWKWSLLSSVLVHDSCWSEQAPTSCSPFLDLNDDFPRINADNTWHILALLCTLCKKIIHSSSYEKQVIFNNRKYFGNSYF
jgi:hypothetical protein